MPAKGTAPEAALLPPRLEAAEQVFEQLLVQTQLARAPSTAAESDPVAGGWFDVCYYEVEENKEMEEKFDEPLLNARRERQGKT